MVGRFKCDFPQEAPPAPFKTVLLSDLRHALMTKRLHNRIPNAPRRKKARNGWLGDGRFVWVRRPTHPLIQEAGRWATLQIRNDLKAGDLVAFMPTETPGIFLRIKPQFWHERRSDIRVDGMIFDLDEIDEATFCVFEECVRSWLVRREIDEGNPAFPDALRLESPAPTESKPLSTPPQRTKQEIINKMKEMKEVRGMNRDEITTSICKEPGFEEVTNITARSFYKNVAAPGRPRKDK